MRFTNQQYAQALYESLHEVSGKDHDKVIANFVEVLKNNGDLAAYEKIVETYEIYDREKRGVKQVEITTTHGIEENKELISKLNSIAGANVEVKQKIDGKMIGGIIMKVDDTLIDGSVKTQLNNLKNHLIQ